MQARDGIVSLGGFFREIERAQRKRKQTPSRRVDVRGRERQAERPETSAALMTAPEAQHADERTIRRTAEHQRGGMSTEEMHARYDSGVNPGGIHQGATRSSPETEGRARETAHAHAFDEEPPDPKIRRPGHGRGMSTKRAGS